MNPRDAPSLDDHVLEVLVKRDQAILDRAAGTDATLPEGSGFPTPDMEAGSLIGCLDLLEQVWPRRDVGQGTGGPPRRIGRFEVLEELGRGGFGVVYKAYDPTLGRPLALKVPHLAAQVNPDLERRFLREARAAGGLDHPNIATVFEAGRAGSVCYIASALCDGPSLSAWLRNREGPAPPRLASSIVARLADAAQEAHDRGILHRDLKPSNVLLWPEAAGSGSSASAADGLSFVPKLTDFGLARFLEEAGDETRTGIPIGSPPYMAPEQAAGRHREVGPACDVYGLGAILYELLTGRPPFRGESNIETIGMVLDLKVVPPRALRAGLARDLETICLTCLEKEPRRRYASAAALADDLRRYLEGRPIQARRPSILERAWRAARRSPSRAAVVVMPVLMVLAAVVGVSVSNARLRIERDRSDQLAAEARRFAVEADRERLAAGVERRLAERHLYAFRLREAREAIRLGQVERAQELLAAASNAAERGPLQDFSGRYLANLAKRDVEVLQGHSQFVAALYPLPGGRLLSTDVHGGVITWDLDRLRVLRRGATPLPISDRRGSMLSGSELLAIRNQEKPPYTMVQWFDPVNGRCVGEVSAREGARFQGDWALAGGTVLGLLERLADGQVMVRLLRLNRTIAEVGPSRLAGASPGGDSFVTCVEGRLRRHDARTGNVVHEVPFHLDPGRGPAFRLDASPDGLMAVISWRSGPALVVETGSGVVVGTIPTVAGVASTVFAPGGKNLLVVETGGRTHLWGIGEGPDHSRVLVNGDAGDSPRRIEAAFSPDGRRLALGNWEFHSTWTRPEIFDVATGQSVAVYPGRSVIGGPLAFTPDGGSLILASETNLAVWRLDPPSIPPDPAGHVNEAWAVAFSPDGRWLATGSDDADELRTLKIWDLANHREVLGWKAHPATVGSLAYSPDGRWLASASLGLRNNLRLWDPAAGRLLAELEGHTAKVRSVAISPDGALLLSSSDDGTVRVWSVKRRVCLRVLKADGPSARAAVFLQGGRTVASTDSDRMVHFWDVASGRRVRTIRTVSGQPLVLAASPDEAILAVGDNSGHLDLIETQSGNLLRTIQGPDEAIGSIVFCRSGAAVAVAGTNRTIRFWDVATGQELLALDGHAAQINGLAFSPDGLTLASTDHSGAVRLWRADAPGPASTRPGSAATASP